MSREMFSPLASGSTIGILGGGQLGRMLSAAASRLGFKTHIYCPEANSPAAQLAAYETVAPYDDLDSVRDFAESCDIVTYEFENVPEFTAKAAAIGSILRPGPKALATAQDRVAEKTFLKNVAKVPVAPFEQIDNIDDLKQAVTVIDYPCVLKTRRFGYDGKGQYVLKSGDDIETAWTQLGEQPCILEGFIPFKREVSIIAARGVNGETASYPLIENVHKNHILHTSTAPAEGHGGKAKAFARYILKELNYFGVIGIEFFQMENGDLIVNEIAPRVHNSGHWTQNAGCIDQFELHIRAITGWPLGHIQLKHGVQMTNLIGRDIESWDTYAREPDSFIHLYGKEEPRPGRKMGHVNRIIYVPRGQLNN
jgi:5-(carboxyamino)imidazole ribonucleotide synthase